MIKQFLFKKMSNITIFKFFEAKNYNVIFQKYKLKKIKIIKLHRIIIYINI